MSRHKLNAAKKHKENHTVICIKCKSEKDEKEVVKTLKKMAIKLDHLSEGGFSADIITRF